MDIVSIYSARNYTDRKVAELGTIGGGGGDLSENPNRINFVPTTPDPVTVGAANSTNDMDLIGEGAFLHVVEYTPSRDITGTLTIGMGADYAEMPNGYEFYIFDKDARTDNTANEIVDIYPNNPSEQFFLAGGVTVYLFWVDWNPVEGRVIDRGPIFNRLKAYELTGIVADDGMFIQHLHEDGTVNWVKYPAATGHSGAWAEGLDTVASGESAHAEGDGSQATGQASHAENGSQASGRGSHSENQGEATGNWSHAEGIGTANGAWSHAEGRGVAEGEGSHAEGFGIAHGQYSHAQGEAVALANYEDAVGRTFASRSTLPFQDTGGLTSETYMPVPVPIINEDVFGAYVVRGTFVAFGPGRKAKAWSFECFVTYIPGQTFTYPEGGTYEATNIVGTPTVTVVAGDAGTEDWTLEVFRQTVNAVQPPRIMIQAKTNSSTRVTWKGVVTRDTFMSDSLNYPQAP